MNVEELVQLQIGGAIALRDLFQEPYYQTGSLTSLCNLIAIQPYRRLHEGRP